MVPISIFVVIAAAVSILIPEGTPVIDGQTGVSDLKATRLRTEHGATAKSAPASPTKHYPYGRSVRATRVSQEGLIEIPHQPGINLESRPQPRDIPKDFANINPSSDVPKIEATIINPFRSAAVSSEVGGIIEDYHFDTGDLVQEGTTILGISKRRYDLAVQKADQNLKALELALRRAKKDKEIKEKLVEKDASSLQDLSKAEAEVEIIKQKVGEAEIAVKQALLDLNACQVKAPFTGYLAMRYKEPFEAVAPLEKLFALVDSSKVYAVAFVPENLMKFFKKGSKAAFNDSYGRQFIGVVDRIEPVMDPKTGSQKVSVLMDNAEENLRIGMTGSLESVQ